MYYTMGIKKGEYNYYSFVNFGASDKVT